MDSYKKLFNNSIIFAMGSLGSKLLNIVLVPLYTYYLSTEEYGIVDLGVTTLAMLLPIVSGSMHDAVLRFSMNQNKNTSSIVTNTLAVVALGYLLFLLMYPFVNSLNLVPGVLHYVYIILLLQIIDRYLAQFAKGLGQSKTFAFDGFLTTLVLGIMNIIFLVFIHLGVDGYFLSMIVAYLVSIAYLLSKTKPLQFIKFGQLNVLSIKELLNYSLPLIPNSLMWWTVNASSRYFILHYIGVEANGIFAVASKIPTVINLVSTVFFQAWQITAIEEVENDNSNSDFFTNIFNVLVSSMMIISSVIIVFTKPLLSVVVSDDFYTAWQVSSFLLLGVVFSSFSSFLGAFYIASFKTKGVFKTSLLGGITSILLNYLLIPNYGLIGAGISSMVSFFIMSAYRYIEVRKVVKIHLDIVIFILSLLIIFVQISVMFFELSPVLELIIVFVLFLGVFIINFKYIIKILIKFINKIKN